MSETYSQPPLFETSVKLCAVIKKFKCLHDQKSLHKSVSPTVEEAWEAVAEECNESVEFCKGRWKSLRRCFFNGVKRRKNRYYLHDHLDFLLKSGKKKTKRSSVPTYNEETNSTIGDELLNSGTNSPSLQESEEKPIKNYENDDGQSCDSRTTSADESNEIIQPDEHGQGVFIIDEIDDNFEADKDLDEEKRLSFKRSCKRALDPTLIDELGEEEPNEKRSRKNDKFATKPLKIKISASKVEPVTTKMVDSFTSTDHKRTMDVGTQYELGSQDFDDIFMQSIKTQLHDMNGRQKMNFKRKIYQSLLEVFDDANDFPKANETLPCPHKQPPCVINSTVGELRLMRELVSLVQAAKTTPEIIDTKEKIQTSTPVQGKPLTKMPAPIVDSHLRPQKSPLSISPTPDDDDLPFFIDDSDEEDSPLPSSWDEIKSKNAEPTKTGSQENNIGLPRRVLQKVVRVSGSNGSTIVARDGDKKRIYRIVPKLINSIGSNAPSNKNDTSIGRIVLSNQKNSHDVRKDNNVGTFYVSNTKNLHDANKVNSLSNLTIRPVITKSTMNTTQTSNTVVTSGQPPVSTTNYNTTNNQTIFKNVHPANRILSSSTGYFKMVQNKPVTPTPTQKSSTTITGITAVTNSTASKVMTARLPVNSMLPPTSNIGNKQRVQTVRVGPQVTQRRYSICGPTAVDKNASPSNSTTAVPKSLTPTSNGNPKPQSGISQIQISQPVSLNSKALNSPIPSTGKVTPATNNPKTPTPPTKDIKPPVKTTEISKKSVDSQEHDASKKDSLLEASLVQREIPILETAGTVEADDLDPLFVKAPHIKSEPIDD